MPDTDFQISETSAMRSEANDIQSRASVILNEPEVIPSEASVIPISPDVILSEAKNLSPVEAPTNEDTLDLALGEELIIEDFTIDGICGVY